MCLCLCQQARYKFQYTRLFETMFTTAMGEILVANLYPYDA